MIQLIGLQQKTNRLYFSRNIKRKDAGYCLTAEKEYYSSIYQIIMI